MARNDGGAAGTVIMSFVLGAVTGAAAALLMAPATGDEMRRKLAEKAREGAEKASEAARQGRDTLISSAGCGRRRAGREAISRPREWRRYAAGNATHRGGGGGGRSPRWGVAVASGRASYRISGSRRC